MLTIIRSNTNGKENNTNKKNEASSSSLDDIEKKIHANQVLYDQLHQSLVDESLAQVDENEKNNPRENKTIKLKKIFLSIFLQ